MKMLFSIYKMMASNVNENSKTMVNKEDHHKALFQFYRVKDIAWRKGSMILGDMSNLIYTFIVENFGGIKRVKLKTIK